MDNLAFSYTALGRHEDALEMKEKALEFNRRMLSEDHPDVGEGRVCGGAVLCAIVLIEARLL
jgi:hypothetical protein